VHVAGPEHAALEIAELVEYEQRVVAGAAEMGARHPLASCWGQSGLNDQPAPKLRQPSRKPL
jgi:hypothetical protein